MCSCTSIVNLNSNSALGKKFKLKIYFRIIRLYCTSLTVKQPIQFLGLSRQLQLNKVPSELLVDCALNCFSNLGCLADAITGLTG